ncbi:MAG TPA: hypothetical protein ENI29_21530 [bacterium]|nr:hypothetical protein [bacterium]
MKVYKKLIDKPYNHFGCGHRIQYLIIYNRKHWSSRKHDCEQSINLNRGLNKIVEYWNFNGKHNGIWKTTIWTPFGDNYNADK